jgi:predicted dehydrogenase
MCIQRRIERSRRALGQLHFARLASGCGRNEAALEQSRARYGWERAVTDWRMQVEDKRVQLLDNVAP